MPRFGPYKYYNDSITLWFESEPALNIHRYLREYGDEMVEQRGVTSILKIIDKSFYLLPWACKKMREKMAAITPIESDGMDDYIPRMRVEEFYELLDSAKKAHKEILDDAGDVGGMAHKTLEDSIKFAISVTGGVVDKLINLPQEPRALSCCRAAFDWMNKHNARWEMTEHKVYSREYEFAGTMDGLCLVDSCDDPVCCPVQFMNRFSLADWKSSNFLDEKFLYQVAAYRYAYQEEHPEAQISDAFILRLGKEDGKFEPWHVTAAEMDEDFLVFKSCMELTRRHEEVKTRMSQAKKGRTQRKKAAKTATRIAAKEKI